MWQCLFLLTVCHANANMLFATTSGWDEVMYSSTQAEISGKEPVPDLSLQELHTAFKEVWQEVHSQCPTLPAEGYKHIKVGFDNNLLNEPKFKRVLGWATRVEILSGATWSSGLSSENAMSQALEVERHGLGSVMIAKSPPGGWWRSNEPCLSKFRLQDVLKHELLHLLGISTTIRSENGELVAGSPFQGICFPSDFDTHIFTKDGERVIGRRCSFQASLEDGPFYVNGAELYQHQDSFLEGTTLSHLAQDGALLTASVGACLPRGARDLTTLDGDLLSAVGVQCHDLKDVVVSQSASHVEIHEDLPEGSSERQYTVQKPARAQSEVESVVSAVPEGTHLDRNDSCRLCLSLVTIFLAIIAFLI